jgi:hypothetical protein
MRAMGLGLVLLLGACGPQPNPSICTTPRLMNVGGVALPPDVRAEACIHRWAYRLAKTADATPAVAEAVIAGCRDVIVEQVEADAEAGTLGFISPYTNKNQSLLEGRMEQYDRKARFFVLQARAGHCKAP